MDEPTGAQPAPDRLLTFEEVATVLGVSVARLRELHLVQPIPSHRIGQHTRFLLSEVLTWAKDRPRPEK